MSEEFEKDVNETLENIEEESTEVTVENNKKDWKRELLEWVWSIAIALVVAFLLRNYVFTLVKVSGPSMENTLQDGDKLFVYRFMYEPENGDIIVFTPERYENRPYIKRVIATAGQTISIDYDTGAVSVDGEVLSEDYIKMPTLRQGDVQFPVTVPEGYFFAMGDNRGNSHDSRNSDVGSVDNSFGLIKTKSVMGKALFRLWPFSSFGSLYK